MLVGPVASGQEALGLIQSVWLGLTDPEGSGHDECTSTTGRIVPI